MLQRLIYWRCLVPYYDTLLLILVHSLHHHFLILIQIAELTRCPDLPVRIEFGLKIGLSCIRYQRFKWSHHKLVGNFREFRKLWLQSHRFIDKQFWFTNLIIVTIYHLISHVRKCAIWFVSAQYLSRRKAWKIFHMRRPSSTCDHIEPIVGVPVWGDKNYVKNSVNKTKSTEICDSQDCLQCVGLSAVHLMERTKHS